jgi:uncharacterized protein
MKINIQNLDNNILELDEVVYPDFINVDYRHNYPDPVDIHIKVDKFGVDYKFNIQLNTKAHYICDRCLVEYDMDFEATQAQIVQIGEGQLSDQVDIIQLAAGTTEVEIDPFLEEIIILNHPSKMLCRENCKGLCPGCGIDLNEEDCRCGESKIDPRWEELKKFIK